MLCNNCDTKEEMGYILTCDNCGTEKKMEHVLTEELIKCTEKYKIYVCEKCLNVSVIQSFRRDASPAEKERVLLAVVSIRPS